jgi:3-methyl-2-oxobutanoate hydroxymethyltransferase
VRKIRELHASQVPIICLTAYDALFARLADEAGVHVLLVGDSLGMTVLGYSNTIPVTLEQSLHHTAAVVRGRRRAMVIGDMPFLTYQVTPEEALRNAGRYLQEAGADGVKLEGGQQMAPTIERLVQAGIPVLGHIGILPQSVLAEGGYRVHGRDPAEAEALLADAQAVAAAGAFAVVLEGMPVELSRKITESIDIPTIGIGAGPHCSGQIQVVNDILGLFEDFVPRHAKRYVNLAAEAQTAISAFCLDVSERQFPNDLHSFK